jgi:hypothetical protein
MGTGGEMTDFEKDKNWSDKFIPTIKLILGYYLIGEASKEEDCERNTDLIVLKMEAVRIACRIRKHTYLEYSNEFTIRTSRPSGAKTELAKIMEKFGDYLFYGFELKDTKKLSTWALIDLTVFRREVYNYMLAHSGQLPGKNRSNSDGSSDFRAFKFTDFPPELIKGRKVFINEFQPIPA